jgi:hypothetical protein
MDLKGEDVDFLLELGVIAADDVCEGRYTLSSCEQIESLIEALPNYPVSTDPRDTPGTDEHTLLTKAAEACMETGLTPEQLTTMLSSGENPKRLLRGVACMHPDDMRLLVESVRSAHTLSRLGESYQEQ